MSQDKRKILFVGGISAILTEEKIESHFSQYCKVTKVRIMREKKTLEHKGFAFVTLAEASDIPRVLEMTHIIDGRKVDVQLASRKGEKKDWKEEQKKRRIFVSNIPSDICNDQLASYFERFGEVRNAYIIRDFLTEQSKNYGYIEFKDLGVAPLVLSADITIKSHKLSCLPYIGRHEPKQKQFSKVNNKEEEDQESNEYYIAKKEIPESNPSQDVPDKEKPEIDLTDATPHSPLNQESPKSSKYEYSWMSSKINEDESNYRFNGNFEIISQPARHSFEPHPGFQSKLENATGKPTNSLARFKWFKENKSQLQAASLATTNAGSRNLSGCPMSEKLSLAGKVASSIRTRSYCCFTF